MIELSDSDILARLTPSEDCFVERKSLGDSKDWLKSAVAFANSAPIDWPALLLIGVKNDGVIEGTANLDSLQQTLSDKLANAYPPIYFLPRVLEHGGKAFLAVIIPGSANRPHFAGQAFVRDGSRSIPASETQFSQLIADRNSKAREFLKWRQKSVIVRASKDQMTLLGTTLFRGGCIPATVVECNQFYVTLERNGKRDSITLDCVEFSFDHSAETLRIEYRSL